MAGSGEAAGNPVHTSKVISCKPELGTEVRFKSLRVSGLMPIAQTAATRTSKMTTCRTELGVEVHSTPIAQTAATRNSSQPRRCDRLSVTVLWEGQEVLQVANPYAHIK